ncbi:MAG: hypothetical protein SOW59_00935 [Corynebacterium sp.]|nr:hypothetical protein [Corynebacterium sp.]
MLMYRLQPAQPLRWWWATFLGVVVAAALPFGLWAATADHIPPRTPVVLSQPGLSFSQEIPGLECPTSADMMGGYDCGPVQIGLFPAVEPKDPEHTLRRAIRATYLLSDVNVPVRHVGAGLLAVMPDKDIVAMGFRNPDNDSEYLYVTLTTTNSALNTEKYPPEQSRQALAQLSKQVWDSFGVGELQADIAAELGTVSDSAPNPLLEKLLHSARPENV